MSSFSFDLIGDLHMESWETELDISPTAPYCIITGDVSRDRTLLVHTLERFGKEYAGVFYIDGNDEHRDFLPSLSDSYKFLHSSLDGIENVVYLQDNLVIINGVAIISTNGWWTYDFDPTIDHNLVVEWFSDYTRVTTAMASSIVKVAYHDVAYLMSCIKRLQKHPDIKSVVVVTHTLPMPSLVSHDVDLVGHPRFNCLGNELLPMILKEDSENKIKVWCFGHYHKSVDRYFGGVRYINNCRGRGDTEYCQTVYYPKRIEINF